MQILMLPWKLTLTLNVILNLILILIFKQKPNPTNFSKWNIHPDTFIFNFDTAKFKP